MNQYVTIDLATGSVFGPNRGNAAIQVPPPGRIVVAIPGDADWRLGPSLDDLKEALCTMVDRQCRDARRDFVTDLTEQVEIYREKREEAERWQAGDEPADYPYLGREAAKAGMVLADLVAEVLAKASPWTNALRPELESSRAATRRAIRAADTIADAAQASVVDWTGLVDATLAGIEEG